MTSANQLAPMVNIKKQLFINDYNKQRMVMNKNTYTGLALAVCLSFASIPLLAEHTPAADSVAPETKLLSL